MSIVWPADPAAIVTDQPRLHALVIGVARYPHLLGGTGPLARDPLGLSQVTTPEPTARAITRWLTGSYSNDACPLGSVELLLSSAAGGTEPATMDRIERAVTGWVQRASSHPQNTAFFYFCGHGLAKDDLFLLPEDFGDPAWLSPWRNCINFDSLRLGLWSSCRADTHILFVDACRETPFGMLTHVNVEGRAIVGGQGFGSSVRTQAVYYAATEGKQAYGPAGDVSYFGQAVLQCLDGLATSNTGGTWVVDTYALSSALGRVMEHLAETHNQPLQSEQVVKGRNAVLHRPPRPKVIARIRCSDDRASAAADIMLRRQAVLHRATPVDPKPLVVAVEPGDWELTITFPHHDYQPLGPMTCTLIPPIYTGVEYP
jgi:hypothetical protein